MNVCIKCKWKSNNELKEIDIRNRVCYYFDDIISGKKINVSNILLGNKIYENVSVYNVSYKTPTGPKPIRIRFNKIDGFIVSPDGKTKHFWLWIV